MAPVIIENLNLALVTRLARSSQFLKLVFMLQNLDHNIGGSRQCEMAAACTALTHQTASFLAANLVVGSNL
jgi:hypothetical protein